MTKVRMTFLGRRCTGQRITLPVNAAHRAPLNGMAAALDEFRKWTAASPAIARSLEQINMIGCGIRLDAAKTTGHARVSLRVAFNEAIEGEPSDAKTALPFSMYDGGGFVISGAGRLPQPVLVALSSAYLQRIAADLKTEEHTELDDETLQQLNGAVERAAADVRSIAVLTQPGTKPQPVYSNDFVALRVSSARDFVNHAAEVMRLWNKANRDADGETKLIYDVAETKVDSRVATLYSLDVTSILGTAPVLPEVRQAMERLFGPGGKMRVWIVRVDDNTVLLAIATPEQVAAALKASRPQAARRLESRIDQRMQPPAAGRFAVASLFRSASLHRLGTTIGHRHDRRSHHRRPPRAALPRQPAHRRRRWLPQPGTVDRRRRVGADHQERIRLRGRTAPAT